METYYELKLKFEWGYICLNMQLNSWGIGVDFMWGFFKMFKINFLCFHLDIGNWIVPNYEANEIVNRLMASEASP